MIRGFLWEYTKLRLNTWALDKSRTVVKAKPGNIYKRDT
jgi:hypothetical protein